MGQFAETGRFGVLSPKWDTPQNSGPRKIRRVRVGGCFLRKQCFQNTRGTYKLKDNMKTGMRPPQAQAKWHKSPT